MQLKSFLALIKLILIIDNKTKYSTDIYDFNLSNQFY